MNNRADQEVLHRTENQIAAGIGQSLSVSAFIVLLTVVIHFFGLAILLAMMAKPAGHYIHDRLHVG